MPRFVKCNRTGNINGDLIVEMFGDDGKPYQFQMTADSLMALFSMCWKAAEKLPPAAARGRTDYISSKASFAILDTQPGIVLMSGPLTMAIPLGEDGMSALEDAFRDYRKTMDGPRH